MIDLTLLLKDTNAYRQVKSDKLNNTLSHAYLIITPDGYKLSEYLKIFASLMMCKEDDPCGHCRACKLIRDNAYSDVIFYPKDETASVVVEDINSLIEESYMKPLESDKKIFLLSNAQSMNLQSQNKLLKTLEEPPEHVHIILGATSEYNLLPTIKSRVKRLDIPAFSESKLFDALKDDFDDKEKLINAIACGDGTVGKAIALYGDKNLEVITETATDILVNMNSSRDVLKYSSKVAALKCDMYDFLSVMELLLRDLLVIVENRSELVKNKAYESRLKTAKNFTRGAILASIEKVTEGVERLKFNGNGNMVTEWLLFQILESKYKWQRL